MEALDVPHRDFGGIGNIADTSVLPNYIIINHKKNLTLIMQAQWIVID